MALEYDVRRDIAGFGKRVIGPMPGGGSVDLEGLDEDERFRLILARLAGIENAVLRLARELDRRPKS